MEELSLDSSNGNGLNGDNDASAAADGPEVYVGPEPRCELSASEIDFAICRNLGMRTKAGELYKPADYSHGILRMLATETGIDPGSIGKSIKRCAQAGLLEVQTESKGKSKNLNSVRVTNQGGATG